MNMRYIIRNVLILCILPLSLQLYGQKPENYDEDLQKMYKNSVELIYPVDLFREIGTKDNIFLLDTREKTEFKTSHIQNARYVGYNEFTLKSIVDIPKDSRIIVYCSLGVRSEQIGEKLKQAGYTNVLNLYGGIFEWVFNDLPVYDKKESETQKIHTYDKNWSQWLLKGEKIY